MLGKSFTTELHLQPVFLLFKIYLYSAFLDDSFCLMN
jgi:hypothetical protein